MRKNLGRISVKFQKGAINLEQQGSDLVADQLKKVQDGEVWLTEIYQRLAKDIKTSQDAIDNGKYVQEAMLSYVRQIREWDASSSEIRLAEALQKAGEFQRCVDDLRNHLYTDLNTKCYTPIREFVKEDIQAAKKSKKRLDAVKNKYESAQNQVKSLKSQKNVLPAKLQAAEDELKEAKTTYETMNQETLALLMATNQTNETKTLLRVCDYLASYHQFFKMGFKWLENLMPMVENYRVAAKQELESVDASKKQRTRDSGRGSALKVGSTSTLPEPPLVKVFGVTLQEVLARENREIPLFLQNSLEYLSINALTTEGIFRISAIKDEIESMKYRLDHGETTIAPHTDTHVVSNIVKQYFRELPEPLLTFDLFSKFVKANAINEREAQLEELKRLFSLLPKGNQVVLRALVRLCARLAKNEAIHKMGAQNLAVVFTPNVLYSRESDPMSMVEEMASAQNVFTTIIECANELFPLPGSPFECASKGLFLEVIDMIDENKDLVSAKDADDATLLHKAISFGHPALVAYLIEKGANVNAKDKNGVTPLLACLSSPDKVVEVASLLISKGADDHADNNTFWEKVNALNNGASIATKLRTALGRDESMASPSVEAETHQLSSQELPSAVSAPIVATPTPAPEVSTPPPTSASAPTVAEAIPSSPSLEARAILNGPALEVPKPEPKPQIPKITGAARIAVAMINIDEIADALLQLISSSIAISKDGVDRAVETAKVTPIMKNLAESLKRLLLDVRGFANNFNENNKKEIIGSALLLQDKIRLVINAVKLLASAPDDSGNRKGFEDSCRQFGEGVSKFYHACENGTNETTERKIQEVAESITHILHATVGVDSEPLHKAHHAASTNGQALGQLILLKSFTIPGSTLDKSAEIIQTNLESLINTSLEIFKKPKEQRTTEKLTAITRTVLLEFRKVKESINSLPKEQLTEVAEQGVYTNAQRVVSEKVQQLKEVMENGGDLKKKAWVASEAIETAMKKLSQSTTFTSSEEVVRVNGDLCAHVLELSLVLPLLPETPTEILRLHSEALVHSDIRLRMTCVAKVLALRAVPLSQDTRNQYGYSIQELANVVASTLEAVSKQ